MSYDTEATPAASPAGALAAHIRKAGPLALISGLGGALAIWALAMLTQSLEQALLIAPFGASCVLLFALPSSPLAQPRNVIGGHFLSALVGLLVLMLVGDGALACGIGVGLAIAVMQITGTVHPPAGGNPLVVILTGAGWSFLAVPVLAGTIALVALAWAYHQTISKRSYPG
ncbi:HPP family protein [Paracoccus onubensis]|uniref:HPP family protein n=1 Tax=Paracoccus onubensis TaxID=1675788 RepID=A0A418T2A7_9RHOB|nr:HPP family protein [Paracoccus onubensis]RJE87331.1 HPP family protein [Paracoccus onubensis]